ncbi:uncharacterized protein [Drosophila tropicalis]|uniref:uncharacterized protein n=1 Tax=Drosophila tropicalis TaxID=46794 RepID=UPI0035AB889F
MHINLKDLLHLSKSMVPNEKIQRQKFIKCDKKSFLIRFELTGEEILIIKQIKLIKKKSNLLKKKPKRINEKPKQTVEYKFVRPRINETSSSVSISQKSQTEHSFTKDQIIQATISLASGDSLMNRISQTEKIYINDQAIQTSGAITRDQLNQTCSVTILSNQSIQTAKREYRHVKSDSEDLILSYSRHQQTMIHCYQSTTSQTDLYAQGVKCTQTEVECKEKSMQTTITQCHVVIQTDPYNATVCTQTLVSNRHSSGQTVATNNEMIEVVEPYKPDDKILTLILTSLKGQSDLLQGGILEALNQLTELTLLSLKKEQDQSRDYFGIIVDIPNEGRGRPKILNEHKSLPKHRTWKCSLKCRACGLHKHRILPVTCCQGTQTEGDNIKVVYDIATQTYKKPKTHWILRLCDAGITKLTQATSH